MVRGGGGLLFLNEHTADLFSIHTDWVKTSWVWPWAVLYDCTWWLHNSKLMHRRSCGVSRTAIWYWWTQVLYHHSIGLSCCFIACQYPYLYSDLANFTIWLSIPPYFNCLSRWESLEEKGAEAIQSARCQQHICLSQRQRPRGFAMSEHSGPEWH